MFNKTFKKEPVLEFSILISKVENKDGNKSDDYGSKLSVTWNNVVLGSDGWEGLLLKNFGLFSCSEIWI